jgi:hypothetical protein
LDSTPPVVADKTLSETPAPIIDAALLEIGVEATV